MAWTSFGPQELPGLHFSEKEGFIEVVMSATGVAPRQWIREGWQWGDGVAQPPFPCFMKAIARSAPPRGRWVCRDARTTLEDAGRLTGSGSHLINIGMNICCGEMVDGVPLTPQRGSCSWARL